MAQDTRIDPDVILLNRVIINRDREALGTLHTRYYPVVTSYIARHVKPREDANDLACDVFTELCQGKSRYQGGANVGSYLMGIARRLIGRHFRKQRRRASRWSPELAPRDTREYDPSRTRMIQEFRLDLEEALSRHLAGAPRAAEAIRLVVIDHLNMQEAANRAGCSLARFSDRFLYGVRVLRRTGSLSSYFWELLPGRQTGKGAVSTTGLFARGRKREGTRRESPGALCSNFLPEPAQRLPDFRAVVANTYGEPAPSGTQND